MPGSAGYILKLAANRTGEPEAALFYVTSGSQLLRICVKACPAFFLSLEANTPRAATNVTAAATFSNLIGY